MKAALPFNVAAGAQQAVTIRFSPTAAGVQTGSLSVASSNDPATPTATASVTGTGWRCIHSRTHILSRTSQQHGLFDVLDRDIPLEQGRGQPVAGRG